MKSELLQYLCCPMCGQALSLSVDQQQDQEIMLGTLSCSCGKHYPIEQGIPRLLLEPLTELKAATAKSFGYEWNTCSEIFEGYQADFLAWIDPIPKEFFKDKLVLDAGCGVGRHTYWAAKFGARAVIGMDFSDSVLASYANTRYLPNAHIVQADIYHPPFKCLFDYIYSIGVLHHLPNPEKGFQSLVRYIKPGGTFSVWLYGRRHNFFHVYFNETVRRVTTRIPHRILRKLCILPAIGLHLSNLCYQFFNRFSLTRPLSKIFPFKVYAKLPFAAKVSDAFDVFATPKSTFWKQEEIEGWYRRAGFKEFSVGLLRRKSLKGYGIKPN